MSKEGKIKLLKSLNEGKIKVGDIPFQLALMGVKDVIITLWHEIKPGVYEHQETGRIINEGEPVKDLKPGEIIIKIKLFREDGTRVPTLASSEKEIILE